MLNKILDMWRRWSYNLSIGFADQALLSGVNFIFNVLLVRWLLPGEYGAFAVVFAIFLFLSGFQNALILQPASVIGVARYNKELPKYLSVTTGMNNRLTLGMSVILILISLAIFIYSRSMAYSFFGLALATPCILLFWLFRQICYIKTQPEMAWKANLVYTVFLIGGVFLLKAGKLLSPFSAFVLMAAGSLLATLIFWRYLEVNRIRSFINKDHSYVKEVMAEHWRYGRWVTGSAFVSWLSTVSYLPLVGLFIGLEQAGAFRAMQNLILPLERALSVFPLLLIPWISKNKRLKGEGYFKNRLLLLAGVNLSLAGMYGLFLAMFGDPLSRFLYGTGYVASFTWLLPYFIAIAIAGALIQVLGIGLKILERPDEVFWSETIATILTFSLGLYLISFFKLKGAALGLTISTMAMLLSLFYFLRKSMKLSEGMHIDIVNNMVKGRLSCE
jgi:O-antigen/teichoic acid export membrane protein